MTDETQEVGEQPTKHSDVLSVIAEKLAELHRDEPHAAVEDALRHVESAAATLAGAGL